jgi:sugar phosphate isomerase/epimerase
VAAFEERIMKVQPSAISRRDWLLSVGAAALAAPVLRAAEADLKARAKKNIKLAVVSSAYGKLPLAEAAKKMKAHGFSGVILDYAFSDLGFNWEAPDWEAAKRILGCFTDQDIAIVGLSTYYNVIDPDPARRKRGEARMEFFIENWKRLGSPILCTETGTLNAQSEWLDSPENSTEKAYLDCRAVFERLASKAEKTGAVVAIEPYWKNIIASVDRAERLFREVPSKALKLVMDPCNYYRKEDLPRMGPILEDIFRRLGERTVIAHAKDVKAAAGDDTDLPASGLGALNYPLYLRLLAKLDGQLYLALEHLSQEDVPRARDFVLAQIEKV